MKLNDLLAFFGLLSATTFAQPANDTCSNATRLCPNVILAGTTTGATTTGSTDYNVCFTSTATVWYVFTTDADGGTVTISLSNLVFNPDINMGQIIEAHFLGATTPCDILSYTLLS